MRVAGSFELRFVKLRSALDERLEHAKTDIDLLLPGLTLYLPFNLWLTEKVYIIPNTGAITLSSQLTWRPTDRLQLFASGSFGTSTYLSPNRS